MHNVTSNLILPFFIGVFIYIYIYLIKEQYKRTTVVTIEIFVTELIKDITKKQASMREWEPLVMGKRAN